MDTDAPKATYACPKCGSDNIQLFSMVFQNGTSTAVHQTSGVGLASGGGVGVFGATTTSASSTLLADKVVPPATRSLSPAVINAILGGVIVIAGIAQLPSKDGSVVGLIFCAAVAAVFFWRTVRSYKSINKWNTQDYPRAMEEWEHSWVCHKCGNAFQLP